MSVTNPFDAATLIDDYLILSDPLTLSKYAEIASTTAIYPEVLTGSVPAISYCIIALLGEAGELANKWKKALRGDSPHPSKKDLAEELGDALWYLAMLANELMPEGGLEEVALGNLRKLAARKAKGTLQGEGDQR